MSIAKRFERHIVFGYFFLVLAAFFGMFYAMQLLGYGVDLIRPDLTRSMHISLMLYGFPSLMLTFLPFALFDKEGIMDREIWIYFERFLYLWYLFLVLMIFSLLYGATRGLPFYDFPYELNFVLAFGGLFYIIAIFKAVKKYTVKPLWVKVSLFAVTVSPVALIVLMNPEYGQVEKMLQGPHGDNTLGMSFALLVLYYLVIKLSSEKITFVTRWHLLWIIPLTGYAVSVFYRIFIGTLSYGQEWFFQYLTLLYIPLLYRWWRDAGLRIKEHMALFISMAAFVFADLEGNILFIPHLRALFHRNDLVVGHAHIAVGIGFLFLALAVIRPFFKIANKHLIYLASMLVAMAGVLSLSGIEQAGFATMHTEGLWILRWLFGTMFFIGLIVVWARYLKVYEWVALRRFDPVGMYHMAGFLSDGIGGIVLVFFAPALYRVIGQAYTPGYQQIVFGFVAGVGMLHLTALFSPRDEMALAKATVILRLVTAAGFFALYKTGVIGWIAIVISLTDLAFVVVYILYLRKECDEKVAMDESVRDDIGTRRIESRADVPRSCTEGSV